MAPMADSELGRLHLRIKFFLLTFSIGSGLLGVLFQIVLSQNMSAASVNLVVGLASALPCWFYTLKGRESLALDALALVAFGCLDLVGIATTDGLRDPVGVLALVHFPITTVIVFGPGLYRIIGFSSFALLAATLIGDQLDLWQHFRQAEEPNAERNEYFFTLFYLLAIGISLLMFIRYRLASDRSLQETLAHLRQNNEQQSRMFRIIAHELRTPAAAIEMMLRSDGDLFASAADPSRADGSTRLHLLNASSHLLSVIDDLRVAVNPLEEVEIRRLPFRLPELVRDVEYQMAPMLAEAGLTLVLDLPPEWQNPEVAEREIYLGDSYRVRAVISNLIRNACLHSQGSTVWLGINIRGDIDEACRVVMCVDDNGVGLGSHDVEELFSPFARGDTLAQGSGIGLYIVKHWIELMGGCVRYQVSPKGGSRFEVELFLDRVSEDADALPAAAVDAKPSTLMAGKRVLLAEDDRMLRTLTRKQLAERYGVTVSVANDGGEALALFESEPFDLIVTDYFMPVMDGRELILAIKEKRPAMPVIALTAATIGQERDELLAAGADAVLSKPLNPELLDQIILDLVRGGPLAGVET